MQNVDITRPMTSTKHTQHCPRQPSLLIFSIALNGYQWMYREHLASQARYAQRLNANYVLIDRPLFTRMGTECCWLKLMLLKQALIKGYDSVLFLDADAMVSEQAPDIRENFQSGQHIYMAKGKTQRYNSGVILLRNHPDSLRFVNQVLACRMQPVPKDCDVGWGENGHVIQVAKQSTSVTELDLAWNNTWQPTLHDYIRHFNFGIMRNQQHSSRWLNLSHWCLARLTWLMNKSTAIQKKLKPDSHNPQNLLENLLAITRQSYPQYF